MLSECKGSDAGLRQGGEGLVSSRERVSAAEHIYYRLRAGPWPSSGKILLIKQKFKNLVNTSYDIEHLPARFKPRRGWTGKTDDGFLNY